MNSGPNVSGAIRRKQFDVIRELMMSPRTIPELSRLCELGENATRDLLIIAMESGVVHITPGVRNGRCRPAHVYHWCPVPFEKPETAKEAA